MFNGKVIQNCVTDETTFDYLTGEIFSSESICVPGSLWFDVSGFTKPTLNARCVKFLKLDNDENYKIQISRNVLYNSLTSDTL